MARSYNRPPGVVITETTQSNISPLLATPDQLCLVGPASNSVQVTEVVTLSGTTASSLKQVASTDTMTSSSIISVTDYDSASAQASNAAYTSTSGYASNSYTFNYTNHTIARVATATEPPLAADISDTAQTVTATATSLTPFNAGGGIIYIDSEQIQYGSATNNGSVTTFSNCTRGYNGTTAAAHTTASSAKVKYNLVIPDNRTVYVTYTYTPKDYYYPFTATATEYSKIEDRFGPAFKDDGTTVNSPLTLAAKIAIENGARDLVLQPVFYSTNAIDGAMATREAPPNAQLISSTNTWAKSFRALQSEENIGVIVAVVGQNSAYSYGTGNTVALNDAAQLNIMQALQQHIAWMDSEYDRLIIGVVGEDSTDSTEAHTYADRTSTLLIHIQQLRQYRVGNKSFDERMVFIAQTNFKRPSTVSATSDINLGGQYAAAAVAGKIVSYNPEVSLTRKTLAGFKTVVDTRSKRVKTQDSGLGFFVIEQNPTDNSIVVRHALTTDITSVAKSELNAIRAKYYMINSLRRTIDTQIIGQVVADDTAPTTIVTTVASTLRTLQDDGVIVQFDSVQAQIDSIDPTEIGIRFNYRPAFAVNYVNIKFSVDLSSGITSLTTTDQANIGA